MNDRETTLAVLKERLATFQDERDWAQFHDPKNVAVALSIETGELLEHFLWKTKEQIAENIENNPRYAQDIRDELADIFTYVLHMANTLGVDLAECLSAKMAEVAAKYPVDQAKGNAIKYNRRDIETV